jgi:hypothetical protein
MNAVRGLAVMQDDTVLCRYCLDEHQAEQRAGAAASIVHAWLGDPAGEACCWCGASDDRERER